MSGPPVPSKDNADAPAWEVFKENAQPLKRGRNVKRLGLKLAAGPLPTEAAEKASKCKEAEFEAAVAPEAIAEVLDPLAVWIRYINWAREEYPSGTGGASKAIELMERCTRSFNHDPRFRNDERLVKVWIAYADQMANPGDIFKFLHKNKIGAKVALFWVAWAFVAEKGGQDKFADKLFAKGLDQGAAPKELIASRQKQFQRRLARRWINKQAEEGAEGGDAALSSSSSLVPASADSVAAALDENGAAAASGRAGGRTALGSVSRSAAETVGARRHPSTAAGGGSAAFVNGASSRPTVSASALSSSTETAANGNVGGFQIFADTEPAAPFAFLDEANEVGGTWGDLAPLEERIKENTDRPRRWNDPEVLNSLKTQNSTRQNNSAGAASGSRSSGSGGGSSAAGGVSQRAVVPTSVFVDESFQGQEGDLSVVQQRERGGAAGAAAAGAPKLSVRAVLDRPQSTAEALAADPLCFFDAKQDKGGSGGGDADGKGKSKKKEKGKAATAAATKKKPFGERSEVEGGGVALTNQGDDTRKEVAGSSGGDNAGASGDASVGASMPTSARASPNTEGQEASALPETGTMMRMSAGEGPGEGAAAAAAAATKTATEGEFDFPCGFHPSLLAPMSPQQQQGVVLPEFAQSECSFEERRAVAWWAKKQQQQQQQGAAGEHGGNFKGLVNGATQAKCGVLAATTSSDVSMEEATPLPNRTRHAQALARGAARSGTGAVPTAAPIQVYRDDDDDEGENRAPVLPSKVKFAIFSDDTTAAAPEPQPTPVAPTPAPPRRVVGAMTAARQLRREAAALGAGGGGKRLAANEDVTINTATAMKAMRDIFGGGGGEGEEEEEDSFNGGGSRVGPLNFSCAKANTPFHRGGRSDDEDEEGGEGGGEGGMKSGLRKPFACLDDYAAAIAAAASPPPRPRSMPFEAAADDDDSSTTPRPQNTQAPAFAIYQENEESTPPRPKNTQAPAFAIYQEKEDSTPPRSQNTQAPAFAIYQEEEDRTPPRPQNTQAPAFAIYQEEEDAESVLPPPRARQPLGGILAGRGDGGGGGGGGPVPFAIFSDDNGGGTDQGSAGVDDTAASRGKEEEDGLENMAGGSRLPLNPARRLLSEVAPGEILRPLKASKAVGEEEEGAYVEVEEEEEEVEDFGEGPMPEEAEIYQHMRGLNLPEEEGGAGRRDAVSATRASSGASAGGSASCRELSQSGHLDSLRGGLFDFAIYEDSAAAAVEEGNKGGFGGGGGGGSAVAAGAAAVVCSRKKSLSTSGSTRRPASLGGDGGDQPDETVHPADLAKLATDAGVPLAVHLHGSSGIPGVGRRETIEGGADAVEELLAEILGVDAPAAAASAASAGNGGASGAGGREKDANSDNTLELCSVLPAPPALKTLPGGVASPSWSRRETADPADLMALLLEFQSDDDNSKATSSAVFRSPSADPKVARGAIKERRVQTEAPSSINSLPFQIFNDN